MSINTNLVSSLNDATIQINRHGAALMLLFGTIGNLLNISVLSERTLRKSPCAIYLSWSSVSSLIFIWAGFLTRVLQGYDVNWPNENQIVCKIRQYILNISWAIGMWCLVGANIDRYLCSSRKNAYRRLSTNRTARYFLIGNLIFFGIFFIEVIYCFEASVPSVPVACYGRNIPCRLFNDWAALSFDIILPSIFLATFGALTIRNHRRRVVYPIINTINPKYIRNHRLPIQNNDRNLTRMLLIQVLVVLLLDLPFGIYRPYASLTSDVPKSAYRVAVENLVYSIIVLLICFTHSTSFYLYTLTGSVYRAAFRHARYNLFNCFAARD